MCVYKYTLTQKTGDCRQQTQSMCSEFKFLGRFLQVLLPAILQFAVSWFTGAAQLPSLSGSGYTLYILAVAKVGERKVVVF